LTLLTAKGFNRPQMRSKEKEPQCTLGRTIRLFYIGAGRKEFGGDQIGLRSSVLREEILGTKGV